MASEVTTPPLHSKRVQAWLYAVVNPLIESLRGEIFLLVKRNLSWRFYSRRCEYIRPITEYISSSQLPNYEDFIADKLNLDFKTEFDTHDHQVAQVESRAAQFFDGLMRSNMFLKQVKESLEEYESAVATKPLYLSLDSMRNDLPKYVAEFLINGTDVLPNHYVTHKFWEEYGRRFIKNSADEFQAYLQRQSYQALKRDTDQLRNISDKLLTDLENHRRFLCSTYDIPAAPILVDHGDSADVSID